MMNNYEELKLSVIVFEQDDIITNSSWDNLGGIQGGWGQ